VLEVIIVKDTTMRGHNVQMMVYGPTISAKRPSSAFQRLVRPGSVTIHFGGDSKQPNYFPLVKDWNYQLRQYRPRKEVLEGKWQVPEPVEVK
jgi:hypothetical protein